MTTQLESFESPCKKPKNYTENHHNNHDDEYSSSSSFSSLVRVQLIDFSNNFPTTLMHKFKSKRLVPFSSSQQSSSLIHSQIDQISNVGNGSNLKTPFDVKICHSHNCIIVSDHGNNRIVFFDLLNRGKLKKIVELQTTPVYIDVVEREEDCDSFLLISCCDGLIYKYNILEMLNSESSSSELNCVWTSPEPFDGPAGLKCYGGVVYCCDPYLNFTLLNLEDGSVLEQIDNFGEVWNVEVIDEFTLALTNQDEKKLDIVKKVGTDWKVIKTIPQNKPSYTYWSTVFDRVARKLVCVNGRSIVVMDLNGNIESKCKISYSGRNQENEYVGGCTIDPYTGLLYFADYSSNSLRIFK